MVKRQKEKQYQSAQEQRAYSKLRSGVTIGSTVQRKLPFHCCALTLVPFVNPVCTSNGIVFDNTALLPFLLQHQKDPVTGHPLTTRDIITLHMDLDDQGRWQCPVLTKPFADHSKIVAIRDEDNNQAYVYSYEAYKELNLKPKNYVELTTGKKFNPQKDVIILNDPDNPDFDKLRDINSFWHITNARAKEQQQPASTNVRHSVTATRIMEQIQKEKNKRAATESASTTATATNKKLKIFSTDVTGIQYTSGKASGSLTSTAMDVASDNTAREANPEEILQVQFQAMKNNKKKGYVQLFTNRGEILLELHCDIVPRTCTNFLGLCEANKYQKTKFHRLIPNFMIQGGKSNDGDDDDASLWGPAFADEFDDRLKHTGGGVVSMANAGPGTNKRQFFITFKSCPHLDRKHSIFAMVIKGMEVVQELGKMPTDKKDRPLEPVIIERTEILVNPAQEAEQQVEKEIEERAVYRRQEEEKRKANALGRTTTAATKAAQTKAKQETKHVVGKYLPKQAVLVVAPPKQEDDEKDKNIPFLPVARVKPPPAKSKFGNFSGW
jgi:peptidyl-prolyl cis-trans isomerase-like protein 2